MGNNQKEEAWEKYWFELIPEAEHSSTSFYAGYDARQAEIDKLKKEVRIEGMAKSEAQALIEWHQSEYSKLIEENGRLRDILSDSIQYIEQFNCLSEIESTRVTDLHNRAIEALKIDTRGEDE